mmetsp:Transcript_98542/g.256805  ORF Transcript_98542/g.256805 Transcript_98542/m.256805 type:complete len:168 (-) Transcript_98542:93-596(-)
MAAVVAIGSLVRHNLPIGAGGLNTNLVALDEGVPRQRVNSASELSSRTSVSCLTLLDLGWRVPRRYPRRNGTPLAVRFTRVGGLGVPRGPLRMTRSSLAVGLSRAHGFGVSAKSLKMKRKPLAGRVSRRRGLGRPAEPLQVPREPLAVRTRREQVAAEADAAGADDL